MSNLETLKAQHPICPEPGCGLRMTRWYDEDPWYCHNQGLHERDHRIACLEAKLQQHEATIAERTTQRDECGRLAAEETIKVSNLRFDLAAAQATIQQQARELEEALGNILNYSNDPPLVKYAQEAFARQSARSQQAEAKKEE